MSSSGASSSDTGSGDEDQDSLRDVRNVDNSSRQSASTNEVNSYSIESIRQYLAHKLDLHTVYTHPNSYVENREQVLETLDVEGLIKYWKANGFKNIITMVGAGISTSAGIPDFRSPETGLYNNLQKYNLPHPTAIFELEYFRYNPKPFFVLAKDLYPGTFKPTPCHYFIKLLNDKGLLLRHYTQNIDTLERIAGLPDDKIVEAHGTFYTNHCIFCRLEYSMEWVKDKIFSDEIPTCDCGGIVKPDIVFFGENLSEKFYDLHPDDFDKCDLLIIMGTSLGVQPFASLIDRVGSKCVRLLINREKVGNKNDVVRNFLYGGGGLYLDSPDNWRDISLIGNCDEGVHEIANLLGFGEELIERISVAHSEIDASKQSSCPCPSTVNGTSTSAQTTTITSQHSINETTEKTNDDASQSNLIPKS